MDPVGKFFKTFSDLPVMLDGEVVGYVPSGSVLDMFEKGVRKLKVETPAYSHLEVVVVTSSSGTLRLFFYSSLKANFPVSISFLPRQDFCDQ